MRSQEEIKSAIERLEENKSKCRSMNSFGESNHDVIDAMVRVLEEDMDEDEFDEEYEDSDRVYQSGRHIYEWLNGDCEISELLYPE